MFGCLTFLIGWFLLFPKTGYAAWITEWNFEGGVPGRWEVTGLDNPLPGDTGLHVKSSTEGRMMRPTGDVPHRIDGLFLRATAIQPAHGMLLWHKRGTPEAELVTFPFTLNPGDGRIVTFNVGPFPQWDPYADKIGLAFNSGTDVVVHALQLAGFTPMEQFIEAWRTFWTFDIYTPYSINFLWGPLLTFNPIARDHMFDTLPPRARSGTIVFYVLGAIAGLFVFIRWIGNRKNDRIKKSNILILLSVLTLFWIIFDIRMGLEWMNYFARDLQTYHLNFPPTRSLRERGNFYDFAEAIKPHISGEDRYIFMAQRRWPFLGAIRYITFPILPTDPDQRLQGVRNWVIFDRSDIVMNADNRLETEGQVFTGPGEIIFQFDDGSFVFHAR